MATITKDGAAWKTVTPGDFTKTGDDTWSCTISFTEDGDYVLSGVQVSDIIGRTGTAAGDTFTIDKTAPTMQVTFDNNNVSNGMYYNEARTATITVTEHNFDPSLVNITRRRAQAMAARLVSRLSRVGPPTATCTPRR